MYIKISIYLKTPTIHSFFPISVTVTSQASVEQTVRQVCQQIVQGVEHEQKKTLWIISSDPLWHL